ncbi:MAG: thiopurine S-methyltransferase [Pseudomonadota bacterium]
MEHHYWHGKWAHDDIAFHEGAANILLTRYADRLPEGRLFLPLCGKTVDMAWLRARGHRIVGAELSETAVQQFFAEHALRPEVTEGPEHLVYAAEGIEIHVGDLFKLTAEALGPVAGIYDRAALVALPPSMQQAYVFHMHTVAGAVPRLLISLDYPDGLIEGPPFATSGARIAELHGPDVTVSVLEERDLPNGLKGRRPVTETIYLVEPGGGGRP